MEITIKVCDVCQDRSLPVRSMTVQGEGVDASIDLCDEHAANILGAVFQAEKPPQKTRSERARTSARRRPTPAARQRARTKTIEEIEAMKRERSK